MIGASIEGRILDVQQDTVRIHLTIDESQKKDEAYWFPYSTMYTAEGNSGLYCMPEVGDVVQFYLSNAEEAEAVAMSSVRRSGQDSPKLSDPSVKYLGNPHGKEMKLSGKEFVITAKADQMYMNLSEEGTRLAFDGGAERSKKMFDSPYGFGNWLTNGSFDLVDGAFNPEDPLSKEHWLSSFGLAGTVAGGGAAAQALRVGRNTKPGTSSGATKDKNSENTQGTSGKESGTEGTGNTVGNFAGKINAENIPNMSKQEILDSLPKDWKYTENNGIVHIRDANGNVRMKIDPPDKVTKYDHVHLFDESGNPIDVNLNVVDRKSPDAHIPYKK